MESVTAQVGLRSYVYMRRVQWEVVAPLNLAWEFMKAFGEAFPVHDLHEGSSSVRPVDGYFEHMGLCHVKVSVHELEEDKLQKFCDEFFESPGIFHGPRLAPPIRRSGMKGLERKDLGCLNRLTSEVPLEERRRVFAEVRQRYAGDPVAQRQIDTYDNESEYGRKVLEYRDALMARDKTKAGELNAWFEANDPAREDG